MNNHLIYQPLFVPDQRTYISNLSFYSFQIKEQTFIVLTFTLNILMNKRL